LVDPNSPAELSQRILLFLEDRQRYEELRQWSLTKVQSLSWTGMAEKYVEFWMEIQERYMSNGRRSLT
jgi:glycosyltransferase involved in cell wall biosynthesis